MYCAYEHRAFKMNNAHVAVTSTDSTLHELYDGEASVQSKNY